MLSSEQINVDGCHPFGKKNIKSVGIGYLYLYFNISYTKTYVLVHFGLLRQL